MSISSCLLNTVIIFLMYLLKCNVRQYFNTPEGSSTQQYSNDFLKKSLDHQTNMQKPWKKNSKNLFYFINIIETKTRTITSIAIDVIELRSIQGGWMLVLEIGWNVPAHPVILNGRKKPCFTSSDQGSLTSNSSCLRPC